MAENNNDIPDSKVLDFLRQHSVNFTDWSLDKGDDEHITLYTVSQ